MIGKTEITIDKVLSNLLAAEVRNEKFNCGDIGFLNIQKHLHERLRWQLLRG